MVLIYLCFWSIVERAPGTGSSLINISWSELSRHREHLWRPEMDWGEMRDVLKPINPDTDILIDIFRDLIFQRSGFQLLTDNTFPDPKYIVWKTQPHQQPKDNKDSAPRYYSYCILVSDWSIVITWPRYWSLIGLNTLHGSQFVIQILKCSALSDRKSLQHNSSDFIQLIEWRL